MFGREKRYNINDLSITTIKKVYHHRKDGECWISTDDDTKKIVIGIAGSRYFYDIVSNRKYKNFYRSGYEYQKKHLGEYYSLETDTMPLVVAIEEEKKIRGHIIDRKYFKPILSLQEITDIYNAVNGYKSVNEINDDILCYILSIKNKISKDMALELKNYYLNTLGAIGCDYFDEIIHSENKEEIVKRYKKVLKDVEESIDDLNAKIDEQVELSQDFEQFNLRMGR